MRNVGQNFLHSNQFVNHGKPRQTVGARRALPSNDDSNKPEIEIPIMCNLGLILLIMALMFTQSFAQQKGSFADARDKKTYKTVKIGKQTWMAENLNYKVWDTIHHSYSYCYYGDYENEKESDCKKYGRMYELYAATKACPSGWHLPSSEEWNELIKTAGGDVAGKKLKSTTGWNNYEGKSGNGTDEFGFSALPGGFFAVEGGPNDAGEYGWWWSATKKDESLSFIVCLRMGYGWDKVDESIDNSSGLSVRCIKD
jgi:uncharacterized protein (TIGR02145 family)